MSNREMSELRSTISRLKQCVGDLRTRYGETPAVHRLANDVERLDIDAVELDECAAVPAQGRGAPIIDRSEVVPVPDTPYDPSLWDDADDEGVGGYHGHRL
ncbi:hypothetical protein FHS23_003445 [Prauserella isguenensis]|uniref:Uncharacterized protein n=1 Tax=Prauserella isguenensis TaxID=1470180 RepID=A0A839S2T5_9PSEU|nr:hypothetical protein [Prauserella isguenensis]MBB3052411.1 hypothetical protein [Prauserella isguenensis]